MFTITHKHIFVRISLALVLASLAAIAFFGLPLSIDFKGGALLQVGYPEGRPETTLVQQQVASLGYGTAVVQPIGEESFSIKTRALTEAERGALLAALPGAEEESFTSIGPSVGRELTRKAITASILVALAIIFFVAYAFRGVSKPVASWKYGMTAVVTLLHDIIIPLGIFAVLARTYAAEFDTLVVVALLTVLGLSVSDTIVVFDRIRENLKNKRYATFAETVGNSLSQVYLRSINTSVSTLLVLAALFFFGPESTQVFALMLGAGMLCGTYSSIFLASPLLVYIESWQNKA